MHNTHVLHLKIIRLRVFQSLCIKKVHDMLLFLSDNLRVLLSDDVLIVTYCIICMQVQVLGLVNVFPTVKASRASVSTVISAVLQSKKDSEYL